MGGKVFVMPGGELWELIDARPRSRAADLSKADIPPAFGVYAWYREGVPVYSGRALGADGLRARIWKNHLGTHHDLSRSSFRRNVCEHLGIAATDRTRLRPTVMTPEEIAPVNAWIRECEVAWIEFATDNEAKEFEKSLHAEWLPPLSKR